MFWGKKNKSKSDKRNNKSCVGKKDGSGQSLAGDALRAQALANARAARERIGDETIQKIAEAMAKKENSPMEKAKRQLESADTDRVLGELKWMLDNKDA